MNVYHMFAMFLAYHNWTKLFYAYWINNINKIVDLFHAKQPTKCCFIARAKWKCKHEIVKLLLIKWSDWKIGEHESKKKKHRNLYSTWIVWCVCNFPVCCDLWLFHFFFRLLHCAAVASTSVWNKHAKNWSDLW